MFTECHHGWDLLGIPECSKCREERAPIFHAIRMERRRQISKFGDQSSKPNIRWLGILSEEFGEAAKVVMQMDDDQFSYANSDIEHLKKELVETATVCVAWLEKIARTGR